MSTNFGSKRLVVGAHYGLRDWLAQRVTGALMAFSIDGSGLTSGHGMVLVLKTLVGLVMAAMAVMARQGVMARTRPNGAMSTNLSYTLRRVFSFQSMYAGLSPYEALAVYAVITYMDSVRGVYFPKGGMHAVPAAMAACAARTTQ